MTTQKSAALKTSLGPIELANPILVGAGPSTASFDDIKRAEDVGAGGVIIKSIGGHENRPFEAEDRRRYRWIKGYGSHLKSTYLAEILSFDYGMELISKSKQACSFPIIASVFYPNLDTEDDINVLLKLFRGAEAAGADGIQLDFFYMNLRKLNNDRIHWLLDAINQLSDKVNIPVFPKLNVSMDEDFLNVLATESKTSGLIYLDSINTEPYIDIWNKGRPIFDGSLANPVSGKASSVVTGEPLLHYTLSMTQKLGRMTSRSLSAGGGLFEWEDIVRCFMTGATSVHLTSAVMRHGFEYVTSLTNSIYSFIDREGYSSLSDLIGISLDPKIRRVAKKPFGDRKVRFVAEQCIECGECETLAVCGSFRTKPYNFEDNCDGCSFCLDKCPTQALELQLL